MQYSGHKQNILQMLSKVGGKAKLSAIRRYYVEIHPEINDSLEQLEAEGAISIDRFLEPNEAALTEPAKSYLQTLHVSEVSKFLISEKKEGYEFALLEFMYNRGEFVHLSDFPEEVVDIVRQRNDNLEDTLYQLRSKIRKNQDFTVYHQQVKVFLKV